MVQGSPELPDLNAAIKAVAAVPGVRAKAPVPAPAAQAPAQLSQAPDTVQISPAAQQASQLRSQAEALPEVRVDRVKAAQAQLSDLSGNSAELNAKIAEKLLTEL